MESGKNGCIARQLSQEVSLEVDMLREIFSDRISVEESKLSICLPVDGIGESTFATAFLSVTLPEGYPSSTPAALIERSRGLSEHDLHEYERLASRVDVAGCSPLPINTSTPMQESH